LSSSSAGTPTPPATRHQASVNVVMKVLRFFVKQQNVDQQNVDQQNVDQQNVDQQNVDQQNVDQQNVDK
jgi:hypothetical protein